MRKAGVRMNNFFLLKQAVTACDEVNNYTAASGAQYKLDDLICFLAKSRADLDDLVRFLTKSRLLLRLVEPVKIPSSSVKVSVSL